MITIATRFPREHAKDVAEIARYDIAEREKEPHFGLAPDDALYAPMGTYNRLLIHLLRELERQCLDALQGEVQS